MNRSRARLPHRVHYHHRERTDRQRRICQVPMRLGAGMGHRP